MRLQGGRSAQGEAHVRAPRVQLAALGEGEGRAQLARVQPLHGVVAHLGAVAAAHQVGARLTQGIDALHLALAHGVAGQRVGVGAAAVQQPAAHLGAVGLGQPRSVTSGLKTTEAICRCTSSMMV